jgi:RNA-directed DNA polymerase
MSLEEGQPQKFRQLELPLGRPGEAWGAGRSGEPLTAADGDARSGTWQLMEEVVQPSNLKTALRRVRQNKGSPGIDGMKVDELPTWLMANWQQLREALVAGHYQPSPVKRQSLPKPSGGERELGIPTVVDRFNFALPNHFFDRLGLPRLTP